MDKKTIIAIVSIIVLILIIIVGVYFFSKPNKQTSANFDIQGMKVKILEQGTGEAVKAGDTVTVDYVGTLEDGTKFDSSIDRGQPFEFTLGQNSVIKGWELGVAGMKVGEKRLLTIPPELAYGSQGAGGVIAPNSTLVFEITLISKK